MKAARVIALVMLAAAELQTAVKFRDGFAELETPWISRGARDSAELDAAEVCGPDAHVSMLQLSAELRTVQKPATPALCTSSNQGECECAVSARSPNSQTYTYWDADG